MKHIKVIYSDNQGGCSEMSVFNAGMVQVSKDDPNSIEVRAIHDGHLVGKKILIAIDGEIKYIEGVQI